MQNHMDNAINERREGCLQHAFAPNRNRSDEERVMASKAIRPIRVEGQLAYVPLTQGYEAVIDAADVHLVEGCSWHVQVRDHTVYVIRNDYSTGKQRTIRMHRVLMGKPEGFEVDHIDGDGLNNRRSNLRVATKAQNQHNQRLARHNTSGFKGVGWHKRVGKWAARITLQGKMRHLGYFGTPEEASAAYASASKNLHGEFGRVS